MKPPAHAVRIVLVLLASTAGAYSLYRTYGTANGPAAQSPEELSSLDRRVLLNLEGLRDRPETADFFAELDESPGLAKSLSGAMEETKRVRFKAIVEKHAKNPAFLKALENPGSEPAPCDEAPALKPSRPASVKKPFSLLPGDEPGCAKDKSAPDLFPH
ncbi:MAG: hypothetical protein V3S11_05825 [Elusimicrobiota bacterium]